MAHFNNISEQNSGFELPPHDPARADGTNFRVVLKRGQHPNTPDNAETKALIRFWIEGAVVALSICATMYSLALLMDALA